MLALDLRSLSAMSGLMAVVLGLVLFGVRANFPESIRGLRLWGLAPLLCASSTVLFVLHGVLPAWSLVLGGNGRAVDVAKATRRIAPRVMAGGTTECIGFVVSRQDGLCAGDRTLCRPVRRGPRVRANRATTVCQVARGLSQNPAQRVRVPHINV